MTLLALLLSFWIAVALGYTGLTLIACALLARHVASRSDPRRWPSIHVLRPCEGTEPGLAENLASTLLPYPGPRRITFLVPSDHDPSAQIAREVAAQAPGEVEVLSTRVSSARNRKCAQLAVGLEHALASGRGKPPGHAEVSDAPEVIVQVDSDVRLRPGTLTSLVQALGDDPEVAASFAAPIDVATDTFGDLSASGLLSASQQDFFAVAALPHLLGGTPSLAGPLAAHRTGPLVETGGFASLEHLLGEDWEMGKRLLARGLKVETASLPACCSDRGRTFATVMTRTVRWLMVVRKQRPGLIAAYPLLLAPTPLLTPLALALAARGYLMPLAFLGALVGLRTALALMLRRIHGLPVGVARALALELSAEWLMLLASLRALFARQVVWRGRRLRIGDGGVIEDGGPRAA